MWWAEPLLIFSSKVLAFLTDLSKPSFPAFRVNLSRISCQGGSLVAILIMHVFAHFITFFCVMLWNVIDCVITKRSLRDKRLLEIIGYALVNLTKNWSEVFESMILPWQTPMVVQGVLALCEILYCEFFHCSFSKLLL